MRHRISGLVKWDHLGTEHGAPRGERARGEPLDPYVTVAVLALAGVALVFALRALTRAR